MNKKISNLTICYLMFLLFLFLSGSQGGALSLIFKLLAYIAPIISMLILSKGDIKDWQKYLTISGSDALRVAPAVAPTIVAVMLVSYLTSLAIFFTTGAVATADLGDSYALAILSHAVVPAIFEELLFRYLPMRVLSSHSRRATVLISAFFFSLVHHDLFVIPYAFIAGVMFMTVDLAAESVIPSMIIHLINNALSVTLIFYGANPAVCYAVYGLIGLLALISLAFIFVKRGEYGKFFSSAFSSGEKIKFSFEMIVFAVLTLSMAVITLL